MRVFFFLTVGVQAPRIVKSQDVTCSARPTVPEVRDRKQQNLLPSARPRSSTHRSATTIVRVFGVVPAVACRHPHRPGLAQLTHPVLQGEDSFTETIHPGCGETFDWGSVSPTSRPMVPSSPRQSPSLLSGSLRLVTLISNATMRPLRLPLPLPRSLRFPSLAESFAAFRVSLARATESMAPAPGRW